MSGLEALLAQQVIGLSEAIDDEVASLLVAGTGITLSYNDGAGTLTIASSGGLGGSTGSTDNRILRSDGTGGATVQNSAVTIDDSGNISGLGTVSASGVVSIPVNGTAADPALRVGTQVSGLTAGTNQLHFVVDGAVRAWADRNSLLNANAFNVRTSSGYYTINDDVYLYRNATGPSAEIRAAGGLIVNNAAGSANAALACGAITASGSSTINSIPALGALTLVPSATHNDFYGLNLCSNTGGSVRAGFWIQPTSGEIRIGGTNGGGYYPTIFSNGSQALGFNTSGHAIFAGMVYVGAYTVGTLPSASGNPGRLAQVTDSSVTTNGSAVAGGGSNRVPVFSDGTNWIVK